ncbi:DNA polymerase III PolC-type [Pontiella desulfatans]|uniref:DNA polymerase III PolC-type n=1 Tax=Pontiella desulfatans TaxID=2750659 RepID=A0A6C2UCM0_PONDE|nr:3'-5' exonuclease [Pontiella desulfatans]VGO17171.1 DNA polymerase III PolC-type [Pontiella desulfatans]
MKFVAFDLETTGTKPNADMIVEVGAVLFDGARAVKGFGTLVDPGIPIPPDASEVNGISDDMVRGQPRIKDVMGDFADFCGDLPLVAHNAPFDFKFLLEDVNLHKAAAPKGVVLDTLPLARLVFPGLANYRLGTLVRHFGFPSGTFHRAEEDSSYCGLLFAKILETLEMRGESCLEHDLVKMIGKAEMRFPQFAAQPDQLDLF